MKEPGTRSFGRLPRRVLWAAAGVLWLHFASGVAGAAALEWDLSNVIYGSGGMATGSFVYDTGLARYTNWSISVTASPTFTSFLYTPATSTAQPCCEDAIELISNDGSRVFDLSFSSAADGAESPQSANGGERVNNLPRFTTLDGDPEIVLAVPGQVPEPGSMGLLALGGFIVSALRRRALKSAKAAIRLARSPGGAIDNRNARLVRAGRGPFCASSLEVRSKP